MSYSAEVVVLIEVDGIHCWPGAPLVGSKADTRALVNSHRHRFEIRVSAVVTHNDRQVEFFELRRAVLRALIHSYPRDDYGLFDFGSASCERIATLVLDTIPVCNWCAVYEDGENGAEVNRE